MTYQLAVDMSSRLAAIAPVCGSFHLGFNLAPSHGVPVMDIHGNRDTTVPANTSYAGDGYKYTPVQQIFDGNKLDGPEPGTDQPFFTEGGARPGSWKTSFWNIRNYDVVFWKLPQSFRKLPQSFRKLR